ncbi:MAG: peptidoglycan-binding protein LysM [Pseudomonadota bacterium]
MGLFDFVKAAGKALGFGGDAKADDAADAIKKEVEGFGFDVEDLDIEVDGDTVKIGGKTPTQELREKIILAAGNVEGVARVEETIEAADGGGEAVFHTVEKGDTLWAISAKHLGNGANYMQIFEANRPMLSDPDKIYPGQVLRIPKG